MLILLAPLAVGALGATAKFMKQWKAGKELRTKDTAVVKGLFTEPEWETVETSKKADDVRKALFSAVARCENAEQALNQKGALQ